MDTNENKFKFSGAIAVPPRKVELGEEVELNVRGVVVKIENKDNQDGTMDVIYVVKVMEVE